MNDDKRTDSDQKEKPPVHGHKKSQFPDDLNVPASKLPEFEEPKDFRSSLHWRVFRIIAEFVNGWQFLADFDKTVSFFGSARFNEDNEWYKEARKLGKMLSDEGFDIVTGGGPGVMEAGNKGASESERGDSVGLNIQLPEEQRVNPYVKHSIAFHYFFVRKLMLSYAARAYVFFPGGLGTLDEVFEILTLIQTKKISSRIPIVLVGEEFWRPLEKWLRDNVLAVFKTIDESDLRMYCIVNNAEEAFKMLKDAPPREDFFY